MSTSPPDQSDESARIAEVWRDDPLFEFVDPPAPEPRARPAYRVLGRIELKDEPPTTLVTVPTAVAGSTHTLALIWACDRRNERHVFSSLRRLWERGLLNFDILCVGVFETGLLLSMDAAGNEERLADYQRRLHAIGWSLAPLEAYAAAGNEIDLELAERLGLGVRHEDDALGGDV